MNKALLLFVALLAGCSSDARDMALAEVDLRDMVIVTEIRSRLSPQDGIAFANYIARHHSQAANFCGQPLIGIGGNEPATVGEAVDLSIERDKAERLALIEAQKPKHPRQVAKEEWDSLVIARDINVDSQSRLRMEFGDKAARSAQYKALEAKIAEIDGKLVAMKPRVFGLANN